MTESDRNLPPATEPRPSRNALFGVSDVAVQAQSIHGSVNIRQRPRSYLVPHQLPADVAQFVDREPELAALNSLRPASGSDASRLSLTVITGGPGVGKTALAIHWAHAVRHLFADGQLYINLGGYGPAPPLGPEKVLDRFLPALGVPVGRIPANPDSAAALFRSALDGRRMLIVLDNASSAGQVRPVLPGSAQCVVVVTSRSRMAGLVAKDGAMRVSLDVLPPEESVELLREIIGPERVRADEQSAVELARRCDHLPLALRVAAARVVTRPHTRLSSLLGELARMPDRLDALTDNDDDTAGVRQAFSWSYQALPMAHAIAFRLLGLHTGPDLSIHAAAALLEVSATQARRLLDALAGGHLIQQNAHERYQFHDLLREYAAELAESEDDQNVRTAAVERLARWYLESTVNAIQLMPRRHYVRPTPTRSPVPPMSFSTREDALRWCETERLNLIATIRQATKADCYEPTWQLALALGTYFNLRKHWNDWIVTHLLGISAAERDQNVLGQAWLLTGLGSAYRDIDRLDDAIAVHRRAAELFVSLDVAEGVASSRNNLGSALHAQGDLSQALAEYAAAVGIYESTGNLQGQGRAMSNHATVLSDLGMRQGAILELCKALELLTDDSHGRGFTFHNLGDAYAATQQFELAADAYRQALPIRRATGNIWGEARSLCGLGICLQELGDMPTAAETLRACVACYENTNDTLGLVRALHLLGRVLLAAEGMSAALGVWTEGLRKLRVAGLASSEAAELAERLTASVGSLGPTAERS